MGLGGFPNRLTPLYKEGQGDGLATPLSHQLAAAPPLSLPLHTLSRTWRSPAEILLQITTTTPSCCLDSEVIYHTSAARWNGERKDFIDTVRTTEYGSAAGTHIESIDYINN